MPPVNASSAACAVKGDGASSSTTSGRPPRERRGSPDTRAATRSAKPFGAGYATATTSRACSAGAFSNFGAGSDTPSRGPSTVTQLATTRRMACSGFTQGPPLWLQPGELNIPSSIPRRLAVSNAVATALYHSGENVFTGPGLFDRLGMSDPMSEM